MIRIIVAVILLSGCCKRYENGPGISFRSKSERVCNRWKVDMFFLDHVDRTVWFHDTYPGYAEIYLKDHGFIQVSAGTEKRGNWDFFDYKDQIRVEMPGSIAELVLLKLEEKALWYYRKDGAGTMEYHLVPE